MPGEDVRISPETYRQIAGMGFTLVDAFAHFTPALAEGISGLDLWVASDSKYALEEIAALSRLPWVDAIEAAVVPFGEYGQFLSQRDLAAYLQLAETLDTPWSAVRPLARFRVDSGSSKIHRERT